MAFVFHKYDLLVITTNLSLGYYYLIQYNMLLQEFRLKSQNAYLIKKQHWTGPKWHILIGNLRMRMN